MSIFKRKISLKTQPKVASSRKFSGWYYSREGDIGVCKWKKTWSPRGLWKTVLRKLTASWAIFFMWVTFLSFCSKLKWNTATFLNLNLEQSCICITYICMLYIKHSLRRMNIFCFVKTYFYTIHFDHILFPFLNCLRFSLLPYQLEFMFLSILEKYTKPHDNQNKL